MAQTLASRWPTQTLKRLRNDRSVAIIFIVICVYDVALMYVLRIENTSESDPRNYEPTKAVAFSGFSLQLL